MKSYLIKHLESQNLIKTNQHGFADVFNALQEDIRIDTVYLDFAKAFDKVNHHILIARAILLKKLEVGDFKLGSFSEVLLVYHEDTRYTIPTTPSRELQAFYLETLVAFTLYLILKPPFFYKKTVEWTKWYR